MICQGRLVGSLLLLFVLSACGPSHPGWSAFPVKIYSDSSLTQSAAAQADFTEAMKFWEEKAGHALFDYQGVWSGGDTGVYQGAAASPTAINANVVFFQNPWPYSQNVVGQTTTLNTNQNQIQSAMIMFNPNLAYCSGDCQGQVGRTSMKKALAHELGHFLGMVHNNTDTGDIMYPELQPNGTLADSHIDDASLKQLTQQ